ncbi:MAG: HlyD family efflux transporter periplasmic adaptor subunit [Planctomycetota bacterium]|nr:HlyD family efflux transporter periplasmic adaptor subunit [Planctomycetota bacterium]MDA1178688.1 HlyD family efflux transporter periplasmic adaptor subunit [Planctomycetota bacterium]
MKGTTSAIFTGGVDGMQPHVPEAVYLSHSAVKFAANGNLTAFASAMEQLQRRLYAKFQAERGEAALAAVLQMALELCHGHSIAYYRRTAEGPLTLQRQVRRRDFIDSERLSGEIACHAENACRHEALQCLDLITAPQWKLAVTSFRRNDTSLEVVALVLNRDAASDPMVGPLLHTVTSLIRIDAYRSASHDAEIDAASAFAIAELLPRIAQSPSVQEASVRLATDLLEWLPASHSAVAVSSMSPTSQWNISVAGVVGIDEQSQIQQALRSVCHETLRARQAVVWRANGTGSEACLSVAHERLAKLSSADWIVSVPLVVSCHATPVNGFTKVNSRRQEVGQARPRDIIQGVVVLWGGDGIPFDVRTANACQAVANDMANMLDIVRERQSPLRHRVLRRLTHQVWGSTRKRWGTVAATVLLAVMHVPRPYAVPCDVTLRTVVRRFVAAPFDTRLQECLVRPGDIVDAGQTLAVLDGREMEIECSQRYAEYNAEAKKRDVAMAAQETAEAQQAQAQMERLQLQIDLLEKQLNELSVRSPIEGVVLQGELQDATGAPLSRGDTLFEVGPLERLKADVFVSDEDIAFVTPGCRVEVYLKTGNLTYRSTSLTHVDPAAQVHEGQNTFRAEMELSNATGDLRPGMSGRARVLGPWRPWLWNVLRRPWLQVTTMWGA